MFVYNGRHLLIDAVQKDPNFGRLNDSSHGIKVLDRIVEEIDMTAILPTTAINFPHAVSEAHRILKALESEGLANSQTAIKIKEDLHNRKMQMYGYTCFSIIAESHITLHTFPENGAFSFDAYSCKEFDYEKVIDILKEEFGDCHQSTNVIKREFPSNIY